MLEAWRRHARRQHCGTASWRALSAMLRVHCEPQAHSPPHAGILGGVSSTRAVTPRLGVLSLILAVQSLAAPAISGATQASAHRLRVGLVLSGGGARGAAHIGVLKVLEQLRVPVDAIAGTSMGAVVGGLYASGLSAGEIEKTMTSINWQDALRDRPAREDPTLRGKQEDPTALVQ